MTRWYPEHGAGGGAAFVVWIRRHDGFRRRNRNEELPVVQGGAPGGARRGVPADSASPQQRAGCHVERIGVCTEVDEKGGGTTFRSFARQDQAPYGGVAPFAVASGARLLEQRGFDLAVLRCTGGGPLDRPGYGENGDRRRGSGIIHAGLRLPDHDCVVQVERVLQIRFRSRAPAGRPLTKASYSALSGLGVMRANQNAFSRPPSSSGRRAMALLPSPSLTENCSRPEPACSTARSGRIPILVFGDLQRGKHKSGNRKAAA